MSRTYHRQKLGNLTGTRRFDWSCRCNGGCPYCYDNRFHSDFKNMGKYSHRRETEYEVVQRELDEYYDLMEEMTKEEYFLDH